MQCPRDFVIVLTRAAGKGNPWDQWQLRVKPRATTRRKPTTKKLQRA